MKTFILPVIYTLLVALCPSAKAADKEAITVFSKSVGRSIGLENSFKQQLGSLEPDALEKLALATEEALQREKGVRREILAKHPSLVELFKGHGYEFLADAVKGAQGDNSFEPGTVSPVEAFTAHLRSEREKSKAFNDAVVFSTAKAIAKYPDLEKEGTPLFTAVDSMVRTLAAAKNPIFENPDWPMIIANEMVEELEKKSAATTPAPTSPPILDSEKEDLYAVFKVTCMGRTTTNGGGYKDRLIQAGDMLPFIGSDDEWLYVDRDGQTRVQHGSIQLGNLADSTKFRSAFVQSIKEDTIAASFDRDLANLERQQAQIVRKMQVDKLQREQRMQQLEFDRMMQRQREFLNR